MVRRRHHPEVGQVRPRAPERARGASAGMRLVGAGNPPLHRFRVGLEFALSGHRDLDGMIAHHAAIARTLGEQLGLPDDGAATRSAAPTSSGMGAGWPGELRGEDGPDRVAARPARRVRRGRAPGRRCGRGAGARAKARRQAVRPRAADVFCAEARRDPLAVSTRSRRGMP